MLLKCFELIVLVGVCFVFLFEVIHCACLCVCVWRTEEIRCSSFCSLLYSPSCPTNTHPLPVHTGGKGVQNHTWLYVGTVWGSESGPKCFYPLSHLPRLKWFAFCFKCSWGVYKPMCRKIFTEPFPSQSRYSEEPRLVLFIVCDSSLDRKMSSV